MEDMNAKEIIIVSNLMFHKDYPYNYVTLADVSKILNISKASASSLLDNLVVNGLIIKVKSFINFYYPAKDDKVRQKILKKLGILG